MYPEKCIQDNGSSLRMETSIDPLGKGGYPMLRSIILPAVFAFAAQGIISHAQSQKDVDWPVYDGQDAGDHYSSLKQINRENVKNLTGAWTYDSGDAGSVETNPIIVGKVLYA